MRKKNSHKGGFFLDICKTEELPIGGSSFLHNKAKWIMQQGQVAFGRAI